MKIDIYIPTYNRSELLRNTIVSVLKQTYGNIRIVVSDNASTDSTQMMMKDFLLQYKNIEYFRQSENI